MNIVISYPPAPAPAPAPPPAPPSIRSTTKVLQALPMHYQCITKHTLSMQICNMQCSRIFNLLGAKRSIFSLGSPIRSWGAYFAFLLHILSFFWNCFGLILKVELFHSKPFNPDTRKYAMPITDLLVYYHLSGAYLDICIIKAKNPKLLTFLQRKITN